MKKQLLQSLPQDIKVLIYIHVCTRLKREYFQTHIQLYELHDEMKENLFNKPGYRFNIDDWSVRWFYNITGQNICMDRLRFYKNTSARLHDGMQVYGTRHDVFYCKACDSFDAIASHKVQRMMCQHCKSYIS